MYHKYLLHGKETGVSEHTKLIWIQYQPLGTQNSIEATEISDETFTFHYTATQRDEACLSLHV